MFEPKTKTITRWGLTIRGTDVYFPKKETTINLGSYMELDILIMLSLICPSRLSMKY